MKSNKSKIEGKYKSETGAILYFAVNDAHAEEYGLREVLLYFMSATNEFAKCRDHWDNLVKTKVLKMPKKKAEIDKVLKESHLKGMEHLKKAKPLINKAFNELKKGKKKFKLPDEDFKKNIMKTEKKLKTELMNFDLSPIEIKIILNEFRRSKRIIETEGRPGLIKHFNSRYEELMDIGADPLNAWKHRSTATFCIIVLIILAIGYIATIIYIIWSIANWITKELHDTKRITPACKIEYMVPEKKDFLKSFDETKDYIDNKGFNGCAWCMPEYHTD